MSEDSRADHHTTRQAAMRQQDWTPWLPDPIQTAATPADPRQARPEERGVSLRTRLSELRQQAVDDGHAQGHTAGYAKGLEQGQTDGYQQGHDSGYQAGFAAGQAEGRQAAELAAARLAALADDCAKALTCIEADMGQGMIALSIRIAKQVLHSTVDAQPEKLLDIVGDIVRLDLGKSAALQLYVNPDDLELVRNYLDDEPDTRLWRVVADDSISRGGCKARTALGDIDATLETRWKRVIATLGGDV